MKSATISPKTGGKSNLTHPLGERDILNLKNHLIAHGERKYLAYCVVALNTGLRISDLLRLTIADVAVKNAGAWVVQPSVRIATKKRNRYVTITINKSANETITDYLNTDRTRSKPSEPLFPGADPRSPLHRSSINEYLERVAAKIGIKRFSSHSFRKTFARRLYTQGTELGLIVSALGHGSEAQTLQYMGYNQSSLSDAVNKLNL
jgi:integrase